MKLNIYSFSIFFLILVFLYPLVYYFSEKKISNKNNSLTTYNYESKGFLSIENLRDISELSSLKAKKINEKYFGLREIVYFFPDSKISINKKSIDLDENAIDFILKEKLNLILKIKRTVLINEELLFLLDNKIIFYFNLNEFLDRFNVFFRVDNFFQKKNLKPECLSIKQKFKHFKRVNYALYQFHFEVNQQNNNLNGLENNEKIFSLYKTCLKNKLDQKSNDLKNFITAYYKLQNNDFENNLNKFILDNKIFFPNKDLELKFKNEINIFKSELIEILKTIKIELDFIGEPEISSKKQFQRNFNVYVISFILTFLISLIIFYLLFFFKNNFKFLKKIF